VFVIQQKIMSLTYTIRCQKNMEKNICRGQKKSPSKLNIFNQEFMKNANDQLVPLYQI